MKVEDMHKSWRGEIAHSTPQAVRTPRLGREWEVASKEEAPGLCWGVLVSHRTLKHPKAVAHCYGPPITRTMPMT